MAAVTAVLAWEQAKVQLPQKTPTDRHRPVSNIGAKTNTVSLPNIITTGRVILVPVIFWLLVTGQSQLAFYAFIVAGLSDAVDGYLAKRFDWQTELGSYLDPIADKLLVVSMFIAFGVSGALPSWLVIAVVSRDILIVAGVILAWLMHRPFKMHPLGVSKANTAALVVLVAVVLADQAFNLGLDTLKILLIGLTGALTFASLAAYLDLWLRHMSAADVPGSKT
jgi:cardiolipin synthase